MCHPRLCGRAEFDEDGEKRSKLELVADEIGASLRRAKVQIEKVTRTETDPACPADTAPEGEEPF